MKRKGKRNEKNQREMKEEEREILEERRKKPCGPATWSLFFVCLSSFSFRHPTPPSQTFWITRPASC